MKCYMGFLFIDTDTQQGWEQKERNAVVAGELKPMVSQTVYTCVFKCLISLLWLAYDVIIW